MKYEGRKMKATSLPAMLADLSKVEEVRIIEEAGQTRG